METKKESNSFKVLIFPWLAYGHIIPYLELAKHLSKRNFHIFFCSTAINLSSIRRSLKENLSDISTELVELRLPDFPELPPQYHTTKDLPPHLMGTLMKAFQMSKSNFSSIINTLNPDLLIYDSFQSWAADIASKLNIPSVHLYTSGAASMSFFHHMHTHGWSQDVSSFPFSEIYLRNYEIKKLVALAQSNLQAAEDIAFKCFEVSTDIVLVKTCGEIEENYLVYLSLLCGKKSVPLGPLVHESKEDQENHLDMIEWLDKKDQSSVVFVSFGSECFLSKEEREEIANGLEFCNVNFIWVVRFPQGNAISLEEALPEGFLERVKDRGLVVDGWVPQAKILEHPSTGGFVSHCGWSSIMESLYYGVPLIAMPMHLDQPTNARLLVEIGVGIEVPRDENGQLKREEIAKVVQEVVVMKTGEEVRGKAQELSKKLRMKGEKEIDEAVEELRKLCSKKMEPCSSPN